VIGKGEHDDRVAAGEGGGQRGPGRDRALAPPEDRRVAALRQIDEDLVGVTVLAIVANQPRAEPPRLDAHDRIRARVEGRLLAEHLDADHVFLQLAAAAFDGFLDDEREEPLQPIDLGERLAAEHAVQLLADGFLRQFRGRRGGGPGRHGVDYRGAR
jgi:hypothetical protein